MPQPCCKGGNGDMGPCSVPPTTTTWSEQPPRPHRTRVRHTRDEATAVADRKQQHARPTRLATRSPHLPGRPPRALKSNQARVPETLRDQQDTPRPQSAREPIRRVAPNPPRPGGTPRRHIWACTGSQTFGCTRLAQRLVKVCTGEESLFEVANVDDGVRLVRQRGPRNRSGAATAMVQSRVQDAQLSGA